MYYYDKPIESFDDDLLGRGTFSKILAQTLFNLKTADTFTVGLYGKWGSGKTSIVNMALLELKRMQQEDPDKTIIIHFEPWQFSDSRQLLNQFIIRLANEFASKTDKTLNNIGKSLQDYAEAFSVAELIPVAGGVISSVGRTLFASLGKKMQKDISKKDIVQQKNAIINLLKQQKTKILIIIDDIDRLNSEQIRQVFQLVSSVAKFPNTSYLLVFDKEIVVNALNKVQEGSGEDYLHKIIQMPIQIPEVTESKLHAALFASLDKVLSEYKTPFQSERWNQLFVPCVSPFVSNLRDINRLLNSLQFKLTTISSEVEFSDMVAICAIEIGAPKVFEWIKKHKSTLVGDFDAGAIGTSKYTQDDWVKKYTAELTPLIDERIQVKGYAKNQVDTILNALSYLFPVFASKIGKHTYSLDTNVARKRCFISNTDKFERYFNLDIDNVFITRALIEKIVFSFDIIELEKIILEKNSLGQAYELIEEIKAVYLEADNDRRVILFRALMNVLIKLNSNDSRSIIGPSTYMLAEYFAFEILNSFDKVQRYSLFIGALSDSSNIAIESYAQIINMVELAYGRFEVEEPRTDIEKSFTEEELDCIEKAFVTRCRNILKECTLFSLPRWRITLYLLKKLDKSYIDDYMSSAMDFDYNVVAYVSYISSSWRGSGISYEIKKPPYEYVAEERILQAIDNLLASQELFSMEKELQERAAAFYLYKQGGKTHSNSISQKDAISFLENKRE